MTEREQALELAAKVLANPEQTTLEIGLLARQLVRAQEEIMKLSTAVYSKRL